MHFFGGCELREEGEVEQDVQYRVYAFERMLFPNGKIIGLVMFAKQTIRRGDIGKSAFGLPDWVGHF